MRHRACMVMIGLGGSLLGVAVARAAEPPGTYAERVRACSGVADRAARFACYDALDPERARIAGQASASPSAAQPVAPKFGQESMAPAGRHRPAPTAPTQLVAKAVSATDAGPGYWTIALDDGGRWRLLELVHQFVPPSPGQSVRIRRVALGSFLMFVGQQPGVRVQRLS